MKEPFNLHVDYGGTGYEFVARFERWGYTHRIAVLIHETTIVFEPDEEGGYRALSGEKYLENNHMFSIGLLKVTAEKLQAILS